jgi:hypothetical protein
MKIPKDWGFYILFVSLELRTTKGDALGELVKWKFLNHTHKPKIPVHPNISELWTGFQNLLLGHVWASGPLLWLSLGPDMSGLSAHNPGEVLELDLFGSQSGSQRAWPDIPGSLTPPTGRFLWGATKGSPCPSSLSGHSVQRTNTFRHSLELQTSLPQAPFKSKLPRRDLSLNLEWPSRFSTQALHRWSPCVHYSWGFVP